MSALALIDREDFRRRRRSAGLGPGAFLAQGVKAGEVLAFEEGEAGIDGRRLSAVLDRIAEAERSKRYELPAKVSYQDRLSGLD